MAYSYTLTNILLASRYLLNEATASFWTDAILTSYANEAIRVMTESSGCARNTTTITTVALTRTVPIYCHKCLALEYAGKSLIKITPLQAGHAKLDGAAPQYWFEFGGYVGIEPVPAEAYALTMYYIDKPTELSLTTDVPNIPYSLHGLIQYYVVSRALEQDKKPAEAMQYMNMFRNELDFMSKNLLINVPDGQNDLRMQ
jgi:hypothetical protein